MRITGCAERGCRFMTRSEAEMINLCAISQQDWNLRDFN
jgi:hypothetical protein